jgi:hypothetical protein
MNIAGECIYALPYEQLYHFMQGPQPSSFVAPGWCLRGFLRPRCAHGGAACHPACRLIKERKLLPDASQEAAVQTLALLQRLLVLRARAGAAAPRESAASRVEGPEGRPAEPHGSAAAPRVQGAYLWGHVGSGKTLVLDAFVLGLRAASAADRNGEGRRGPWAAGRPSSGKAVSPGRVRM